jgi:hypothetical protein
MHKHDPQPPTEYLRKLDLMMHLAAAGMTFGIFAKVMFF